jgi:peroxiredoxin
MSLVDEQIGAAEQEWLELFARGPADDRWSEPPPQEGDPAPDLRLADTTGEEHPLSGLWSQCPALLLFWRHYACGCGAERAARLRSELGDYREAGANVVVIGQAEPERSAVWAEQNGIDCPVLSDPDYRAYRAYGLREGKVSQILFDAPEEFWSHSREVGEQFAHDRREQGRTLVDNPWLLPGEFVIDREGVMGLAYRYQYCEDFPNPLVLTTAIRLASS